jgi:ABC-type multidrug transport system permease subunit
MASYEFSFLNGMVRPLVQLKGYFMSIDIMPGVSHKVISLRDTAPIRMAIHCLFLGENHETNFDRRS